MALWLGRQLKRWWEMEGSPPPQNSWLLWTGRLRTAVDAHRASEERNSGQIPASGTLWNIGQMVMKIALLSSMFQVSVWRGDEKENYLSSTSSLPGERLGTWTTHYNTRHNVRRACHRVHAQQIQGRWELTSLELKHSKQHGKGFLHIRSS